MKILFISRAYPPAVGGIEKHNYELARHLAKSANVCLIANKHGKYFLPFFLPYASIKAIYLIRRYDVLLLGDGVLAITGYLVKLLYGRRKKVIAVIHGLDVTFSFWLYRWLWVGKFIPALDKLIAVGNETIEKSVARNIPREKFVFIPNGVNCNEHIRETERSDIEKILNENIEGKMILLTSGRLAKRKGVAWFISDVLPRLPENIIYVVLGVGKDENNILRAVKENRMESRVRLLGYRSNLERDMFLNFADLFIQPNIKIQNDIEGFGISVIEATTCRLPVIASGLEGLKDAIRDGENGFLVESRNAAAFASKIEELLKNKALRAEIGKKARSYAIKNYSWDKIASRYLVAINHI